jgi:signal transduction histidine kinase
MSRVARSYVVLIVLLACAALGGAWLLGGAAPPAHVWLSTAGYAIAVLLVQLLPVPFPRGTQLEIVRVEEAIVIPLVLVLDPFPALLAVACGVAVGAIVTRADLTKAAFNVAQLVLSVAAALAVTAAIAGDTSPGYGTLQLSAAVCGLVAMFAVNQVLVGGIMRLAAGMRFTRFLIDDAWLKVAMWTANVAIGLLLVLPAVHAPGLLLLALVPLVMLHGAWRMHSERARDELRMRELESAVSGLVGHDSLDHVATKLVEAACEVLHAGGAEVRLFDAEHTWWAQREDATGAIGTGSHDMSGASQRAHDANSRVTYTVPLGNGTAVLGEMSVWSLRQRDSARTFSRRDRGLLDMLGNQAATAIDNAMLATQSQLHQRTINQVFEHSSEGMMVLDRCGRVCGWNPAMRAISGFELATVDASPISLLSPQLAAITDAIIPGTLDAVISTADGERRHVRASYAPIESHEPVDAPHGDESAERDPRRGSDPTWVVVVRDVTAEQETERLKDDFVATVSHELRTPLTAIKGFLDTMRRDDIQLGAAQVRMFLQIMGEQADRLERLIGDLLDMSAIESGRPLEVDVAPVDLGSHVRRAISLYSVGRPEVQIDLDDRDLDVVVDADAHRLEQVISNLVDNARKHGGADAPIAVRVTRSNRGMAQVLVTDRGPGISAVDQRRIFERFFVAANSVTRNGGGAGLGLYICNQLVSAMGGTIDVRSRVGEGATFVVELPIRAETLRDDASTRSALKSLTPNSEIAE